MPIQHTWKVCSEEFSGIINMGKAVRQNCLDCSGGSIKDVRECNIPTCSLWPFRMGKDPGRKRELTPEQREASVERLRKAREAKNRTLQV